MDPYDPAWQLCTVCDVVYTRGGVCVQCKRAASDKIPPRPWRVDVLSESMVAILDRDGRTVIDCGDVEPEAAELLVRLVNAEPEVVETLTGLRWAIVNDCEWSQSPYLMSLVARCDRALALLRGDAPAPRPAAAPEARAAGIAAGLAKHAELTSPGPGKLLALAQRRPADIQREIIEAAVDAALAKVRG